MTLSGYNNIETCIFKQGSIYIKIPLYIIIDSYSFNTSSFFDLLKIARVTPTYKIVISIIFKITDLFLFFVYFQKL